MNTDALGNLFVVAAPSGAGKSSLVKALMEVDHRIAPSVSHTTRAPRGQEKDGREYHFVDDATFDRMLAEDAFIEWAHVHGQRYGTSRAAVEAVMTEGHDVVLEIDYQGALQIQAKFPQTISVFILPPSWDELEMRLRRRGEDQPEVIELRMANAREEIAQAHHFQFVIINEVFDRALFDLKAVVQAQRLRYSAQRRLRADTFASLGLS
jgi:guanylate kinase